MSHIEKGWNWSSLLDRHFKLCTEAVKRGVGPAKKAPEVPQEVWKALSSTSRRKARRILSEIGITPLRLWGALDDERNRVSSFDVEERCL